MPKFVSIEEAVKLIPDGASIMFGGFMGCGNAHKFIDALSKSGVKDLTMICNDGSMPGGPMGEDYYGVGQADPQQAGQEAHRHPCGPEPRGRPAVHAGRHSGGRAHPPGLPG